MPQMFLPLLLSLAALVLVPVTSSAHAKKACASAIFGDSLLEGRLPYIDKRKMQVYGFKNGKAVRVFGRGSGALVGRRMDQLFPKIKATIEDPFGPYAVFVELGTNKWHGTVAAYETLVRLSKENNVVLVIGIFKNRITKHYLDTSLMFFARNNTHVVSVDYSHVSTLPRDVHYSSKGYKKLAQQTMTVMARLREQCSAEHG